MFGSTVLGFVDLVKGSFHNTEEAAVHQEGSDEHGATTSPPPPLPSRPPTTTKPMTLTITATQLPQQLRRQQD